MRKPLDLHQNLHNSKLLKDRSDILSLTRQRSAITNSRWLRSVKKKLKLQQDIPDDGSTGHRD